jgi:hypothetical protein
LFQSSEKYKRNWNFQNPFIFTCIEADIHVKQYHR